jgi:hypothetical protein
LDDTRFYSRQIKKTFLLSKMTRLALKPTYPPIQWALTVNSLRIKWPGREVDDWPSSRPRVRMKESKCLGLAYTFIAGTETTLSLFLYL